MGTVLTAHGKYVNNQRHDGENTQIQLQKNVRVCVCVCAQIRADFKNQGHTVRDYCYDS